MTKSFEKYVEVKGIGGRARDKDSLGVGCLVDLHAQRTCG